MMPVPANIEQVLKEVKFPAKKSDILEQVKKSGESASVREDTLQSLDMLPEKEYKSYADVARELEKR